MKWITKITLHHYRAFDEDVPAVDIPPGHHLLIYGENGSGKSSLYHALEDLISSSPLGRTIQFKRNVFSVPDNSGSVTVVVTDTALNTTEEFVFKENDQTSTHRKSVIQQANNYKGFLDYRRMLKLHFLDVPDGDRPNVFDLLVEDLLADTQIPDPYNPSGIRRVPLAQAYRRIKADLLRKWRWRTPGYLTTDLNALASFNQTFKKLLDDIFPKAQTFLNDYFKANLLITHQTADVEYDNNDRKIKENSRLIINYAGHTEDSYQYFLNEARLSAIALSINLASLKINPPPAGTLKVLYLDDVFIGMDMSNRLPLLDILNKEFINPPDESEPTQVVVSTYDRQWYEVLQRYYYGHGIECIKYELYKIDSDGHDRPLVLPFETNFDKAIGYLRSSTKPDYPAAANYLRKYSEELVQRFLPPHEVKETKTQATIEEHKLGKYVEIAIDLYQRFNWDAVLLTKLQNALPTLLHPLSHYELSAPIYKGELEDIVETLLALNQQLKAAKQGFKMVVPPRTLSLTFQLNATDTNICEIVLQSPIYAIQKPDAADTIVYPKCIHKKTKTIIAGQKNGVSVNAEYPGMMTAYINILENINALPGQSALTQPANIVNEFKIVEQGATTSVQDAIDNIQW